jgi:hypothetical protein
MSGSATASQRSTTPCTAPMARCACRPSSCKPRTSLSVTTTSALLMRRAGLAGLPLRRGAKLVSAAVRSPTWSGAARSGRLRRAEVALAQFHVPGQHRGVELFGLFEHEHAQIGVDPAQLIEVLKHGAPFYGAKF